MQYSFLASLMNSVWMLHPSGISDFLPLYKGAFSGLHFEKEPEPKDTIPFAVNMASMERVESSDSLPSDEKFVAVTILRGVVLKHDAFCGPKGTRTIASRLKQADTDKNVIGHVLITESPGGQASAVPELADAINSLTKPVVAWVDGMSASAAYYINTFCDHIMASRDTDQIGCIGTMIELQGYPKYGTLADGSIVARVYGDEASEKNDEFETALQGDFKLIKERILNPHNEQFIADVRNNRSAVKDEHLKGRTFKASDVIGTLIDSIGSFNDAVNKVIELSGTNNSNSNTSKTNNSNKMAYNNLNQIESIRDFELQDGQASFNEQQLSDIDAALQSGTTASGQVTTLQAENSTLTETVATRDARITELETALAAAQKGGAASSATVVVETDDPSKTGEKKDSLSESMSYCEQHLKNFS